MGTAGADRRKARLGLGTQVRTHVVRRYGMAFERPGPRLRDYIHAVKACFAGFRTETLDHHGDFYDLDFISRQWSPGPIDAPDPKVDIAAVNPWMLGWPARWPTACMSIRSASPAISPGTCAESPTERRRRDAPPRTSP